METLRRIWDSSNTKALLEASQEDVAKRLLSMVNDSLDGYKDDEAEAVAIVNSLASLNPMAVYDEGETCTLCERRFGEHDDLCPWKRACALQDRWRRIYGPR